MHYSGRLAAPLALVCGSLLLMSLSWTGCSAESDGLAIRAQADPTEQPRVASKKTPVSSYVIPTVSSRKPLSVPTAWHLLEASDEEPAIAYADGDYFVAWSSRDTFEALCVVKLTRVRADGSLVSPAGFWAGGTGHCSAPDVAWDGQHALVVWTDRAYAPGEFWTVRGALLDTDGNGLTLAPIATTVSEVSLRPTVQAYPGGFVVVYSDGRNAATDKSDIYASRISSTGNLLDPTGIAVATGPSEQQWPDVAWDGQNMGIVWQDDRSGSFDIYGARMDTQGNVLDPAGVAISSAPSAQTTPRLACANNDCLVVWADARNDASDIYGAGWAKTGVVLDPMGIPISQAAHTQVTPTVAWNGQCFDVLFQNNPSGTFGNEHIYGARIDASRIVLNPGGLAVANVAGQTHAPAIACGLSSCLASWQKLVPLNASDKVFKVEVTRVDSTLTQLDNPAPMVALEANAAVVRGAAFDGTNYLVTWTNDDQGNRRGYGTRITPGGTELDNPPLALPPHQVVHEIGVGYNGTNYLLVWAASTNQATKNDIFGARISPSGVLMDPQGFVIEAGSNEDLGANVACRVGQCFVQWTSWVGSGWQVRGAFVDPNATVSPRLTIATSGYGQNMTWDGSNFISLWTAMDLRASRISPASGLLDPNGIFISGFESTNHVSGATSVSGSLVLWNDLLSNGPAEVRFARMNANGAVFPVGGTVFGLNDQIRAPMALWNGTNYLTTYMTPMGLAGQRYSEGGDWVDPTPFVIGNVSTPQYVNSYTALAQGPFGQTLLAYTANDPVIRASRGWFHLIQDQYGGMGESCDTGLQCQSGICLAGVCDGGGGNGGAGGMVTTGGMGGMGGMVNTGGAGGLAGSGGAGGIATTGGMGGMGGMVNTGGAGGLAGSGGVGGIATTGGMGGSIETVSSSSGSSSSSGTSGGGGAGSVPVIARGGSCDCQISGTAREKNSAAWLILLGLGLGSWRRRIR